MKYSFPILAAAAGIFALTGPAFADNTLVEPLYTKSAQRHDGVVFEAYAETYRDRGFQEIEAVDATELRVDLVVPVLGRDQLRLSLPFRTNGDGRKLSDGNDTDLSGNGGTFNFASISYEHPFSWNDQSGLDLMAYVGLGVRSARLETSHGDYMNHRGSTAKVGVRLERGLHASASLLADVGMQFYWDTDDLNPAGGGDNFAHLVASVALIKHDQAFKPALELTYRGDIGDYNNLAIVPEVVYSLGAIDFKLGVPLGLTSDADDYGVTLGLSYRM